RSAGRRIRARRPGAVRPAARSGHPPIRRAPRLGALRRTRAARSHRVLPDILRHLTRAFRYSAVSAASERALVLADPLHYTSRPQAKLQVREGTEVGLRTAPVR